MYVSTSEETRGLSDHACRDHEHIHSLTASRRPKMGGPCYLWRPNPEKKRVDRVEGPPCTDNFQIAKFTYRDPLCENGAVLEFWSAEQAYQALKFPPQSQSGESIRNTHPERGDTGAVYSSRVWRMGNSKREEQLGNWEEIKVGVMYVINCAKYASNPAMIGELVEVTGQLRIEGARSTWQWPGQKWNGWVHMLIREKILEASNSPKLMSKLRILT